FDTRNKLQMLSPQRSAQPASHKKFVAVLPAAARDPATFFNKAGNADRNDTRPARGAGFATNNANFETLSRPPQPAIKFLYPRCRSYVRHDHCDESKLQKSGHRDENVQRLHHLYPAA